MATAESIKRKILELFEDDFGTYLDTVETSWASTEDITLDDIREFKYGSSLSERAPKQWPAMAVLSTRGRDTGRMQQLAMHELAVVVEIEITDPDREILAKKLDRYQEACILMLDDKKRLEGEVTAIKGYDYRVSQTGSGQTLFYKMLVFGFMVEFIWKHGM